MTETEGFPPEPENTPPAAAVLGQFTAQADLTVTPAPEPVKDGDGE